MAASTDRLVERLRWLAATKAEGAPEDKKGIDMWRELGSMTLQVSARGQAGLLRMGWGASAPWSPLPEKPCCL